MAAGGRVAGKAVGRIIGIAEKVGLKNVIREAEHVGGRAAARNAERAAGRSAERAAGRSAERAAGHSAERAAGHSAERAAGHSAERAGGRQAGREGAQGAQRYGPEHAAREAEDLRNQLPNNPTSQTPRQVRNTPLDRRWRAGEQHVRERYGGEPRSYDAQPPREGHAYSDGGGRNVDCAVDLPDGTTAAVEVKTYQGYRTVEGLPQAQEVPLSPEIRNQIEKDIAQRAADQTYRPAWTFMDAGPSAELRAYLTDNGIPIL